MATFKPYGKTPRLNREIIVTEKIDGTNGAIHIEHLVGEASLEDEVGAVVPHPEEGVFVVTAQSRNRIVTPNKDKSSTDNHGFAGWVHANAAVLAEVLGTGTHYGEWFGQGIARNYGYTEKWFALFAHDRYDEDLITGAQLAGVNLTLTPLLYRGNFSQVFIDRAVAQLRQNGSYLTGQTGTPAEGVVVYHTAANAVFKVTIEDDEIPKTLAVAS